MSNEIPTPILSDFSTEHLLLQHQGKWSSAKITLDQFFFFISARNLNFKSRILHYLFLLQLNHTYHTWSNSAQIDRNTIHCIELINFLRSSFLQDSFLQLLWIWLQQFSYMCRLFLFQYWPSASLRFSTGGMDLYILTKVSKYYRVIRNNWVCWQSWIFSWSWYHDVLYNFRLLAVNIDTIDRLLTFLICKMCPKHNLNLSVIQLLSLF